VLNINKPLIAALVLLSGFSALAQSTGGPPPGPPPGSPPGPPPGGGPGGAPGGAPEANPPTIDSFGFTGDSRFTPAQLLAVLKQHAGDKVSKPGVRSDLDAITALYHQPGGPAATVAPNITHPAPGHVVITYIIKEAK